MKLRAAQWVGLIKLKAILTVSICKVENYLIEIDLET
jgi:hypothetical protein